MTVPAVQSILATLRSVRPALARLGYGMASQWDQTESTGHSPESGLAQRMPARRRIDFMLGRRALRRAAAHAGLPDIATVIAPGERGEPRLPAGVAGSISHSQGIAVALAGPTTHFSSVGIDLELSGLPDGAAHLVLTEPEQSWLADADSAGQRGYRLLSAFSAKEAAYKALDQVLRPGTTLRRIHLLPDDHGFLAWPRGRVDLRLRVWVQPVGTGLLSWTAVPAGQTG